MIPIVHSLPKRVHGESRAGILAAGGRCARSARAGLPLFESRLLIGRHRAEVALAGVHGGLHLGLVGRRQVVAATSKYEGHQKKEKGNQSF